MIAPVHTIRDPINVVYDDRTQLEQHLDDTGHTPNDPGRQLAVTMRKRRLYDDARGTLQGTENVRVNARSKRRNT